MMLHDPLPDAAIRFVAVSSASSPQMVICASAEQDTKTHFNVMAA